MAVAEVGALEAEMLVVEAMFVSEDLLQNTLQLFQGGLQSILSFS